MAMKGVRGKKNMILTEEEEKEEQIRVEKQKDVTNNGKFTLVGTLLTTRTIQCLCRTCDPKKRAWKLKKDFTFRELRHNQFPFQFVSEMDKEKVMKGGHWAFDKVLLAMKEPGTEQPSKIVIDKVPFWIRI